MVQKIFEPFCFLLLDRDLRLGRSTQVHFFPFVRTWQRVQVDSADPALCCLPLVEPSSLVRKCQKRSHERSSY